MSSPFRVIVPRPAPSAPYDKGREGRSFSRGVAPLLEANYADAAADLLNPLLDLLGRARSLCHHDMDKALIVLLVLVRSSEHPDFAEATRPERLADPAAEPLPTLGLNVTSVAASLGLPKETTRRKVLELLRGGCLFRIDGDLRLPPDTYRRLAPLREGVNQLAAKYHELGSALIRAEALSETRTPHQGRPA
jgi:hypothetical protein